MEGEGAGELALDETNLVIRAARALAAHAGCPPHARLHLRKQIPLAGGLAGGSADAAAALVACDALWGTGLSRDDLADDRRRRSAPTCRSWCYGGTALGTGRGEPVSPVLARPATLALGGRDRRRRPVHPGRSTASSTGCAPPARPPAAARQRRRRCSPRCASATRSVLGAALGNDLQAAALSLRPELRRRSRPATTPARSPASSPAPARPASSWPPTRRHAARGRAPALDAGRACAATARTARPGRCPERRTCVMMANVVNLDRVSKGYGAAGRCSTDVSLGLDDADRVGVVGLNGAGKSTLLRLLDQGRGARRRPGHPPPRPAGRRACRRPSTWPPTPTVRDVVLGTAWLPAAFAAEHEWAGDAGVRTVLDGLGMPHLGLDAPVGPMSGGERRRVALAALLVRADRPAGPRRADQPPRRRRRRLAGRATCSPAAARSSWSPTTAGSSTRSAPRPGRSRTRRVRAYEGGYAAWTLARAERRAGRRGHRGPPAEPAAQGDRLAAPRPAGPHLQAAVPHRRGQRADRRRAAGRATRSRCSGWPPRGSASRCTTWTDVDRHGSATETAPGRRGPGWSARATGSRIVGANGAGKTTLLRLLAGDPAADGGRLRHRLDRADRVPVPGAGRAARPAAGAGGGRGGRPAGQARRPGALRGAARRGVRLHRPSAVDTRVATCPAASGGGCSCCGCSPASRTCCCSTSRPTTSTPTPWPSLEDLLDTWPGTMVVASHDRYLVERVCDTVYGMFGDGRLVHLPGGDRRVPGARSAEPDTAEPTSDRDGRHRRPTPAAQRGRGARGRARSWPGWSGRSPSWSSARRSCTTSWPARHRLREGRRAGRASSRRYRPSGPQPRRPGSSSPSGSPEQLIRRRSLRRSRADRRESAR